LDVTPEPGKKVVGGQSGWAPWAVQKSALKKFPPEIEAEKSLRKKKWSEAFSSLFLQKKKKTKGGPGPATTSGKGGGKRTGPEREMWWKGKSLRTGKFEKKKAVGFVQEKHPGWEAA